MEYHHTGVGTIVQPTWWVQYTHGHQHGFFKLEATSVCYVNIGEFIAIINKGEEIREANYISRDFVMSV